MGFHIYFYNNAQITIHFGNEYVRNVPIPIIDFSNPAEKARYDTLVSLVDQMLETQKLLNIVETEADKRFYKQKIDLIDKQIDSLVYKLYNLTEEEIKIVEGKT